MNAPSRINRHLEMVVLWGNCCEACSTNCLSDDSKTGGNANVKAWEMTSGNLFTDLSRFDSIRTRTKKDTLYLIRLRAVSLNGKELALPRMSLIA